MERRAPGRGAWLIGCRRTGRSISRISANVFGRARIQSCNVCLHVDGPLRLAVQLLRRRQCGGARPDVRPRPLRPPGPRGCVARLGPINWYASSSNLKLMFDRLVCMNSGNLRERRIADKDPELAMQMEQLPEWASLGLNHLEGRTAMFFCYGDGGGDELDPAGRSRILRHPEYFDPALEPFAAMRDAYAPLVWQCRYGGVEVPDDLWTYCEFGNGDLKTRSEMRSSGQKHVE